MGDNQFLGPIPTWIGKRLQNLVLLSLQSNRFYGSIPSNICQLEHLQLLDLSINHKCISNFTTMRQRWTSVAATTIEHFYSYNNSNETTVIGIVNNSYVGMLLGYESTLRLVKSIDL